jgi:hypothetical protein
VTLTINSRLQKAKQRSLSSSTEEGMQIDFNEGQFAKARWSIREGLDMNGNETVER